MVLYRLTREYFLTPGMRALRVDCTAECKETASVNCSGSLAKRMMLGMTPQVETVR